MKLTQQLKKAIRESGFSRYAIWKKTGIEQAALSRFMAGKSSLTLESADVICTFLKLELRRKVKSKRRGK